jgi:hypothetical protein
MTWLTWLIVVALVTAAAAVTGIKPKGTRPVARTGLMTMARIALAVIVAIVAYAALRGHG